MFLVLKFQYVFLSRLTLSSPVGAKWLHLKVFRAILVFDIRALWRSELECRVFECQRIKKCVLDRYGPEHFGRLIFATIRKKCGTERVNVSLSLCDHLPGMLGKVTEHKEDRDYIAELRKGPGKLADGLAVQFLHEVQL